MSTPTDPPPSADVTRISAARWRAVIDAAVDGIIVIDSRGQVEAFNHAAERMFGYTEAEVLGRNVSILMPDPDRSKHDGYINHYLTTGERKIIGIGRPVTAVRRDGERFPVHLSVGEMEIDGEKHFTGILHDLSRRTELEERLREATALARLGEMAAVIAHEVKNPLAGIEVMAGLLKRQLADSEDAQQILGDIIKEAKMANAIVLEVLDFVRPIRLQVERISVADAIRDAVSMAESHVPRGDVKVTVDLPEQLPSIQGDPHQLRQIFTNLLTNAFEALGGDGAVTIVASALNEEGPAGGEPQGPMVQVDVTDDGPGMPADVVDKIFSPFFTTKPQGSGLGLAIVRKIVDAHDGRIDVRVLDPGGTRFRVTLPVTGSHQLFG
jgi:PAS domain S-box-containing protein